MGIFMRSNSAALNRQNAGPATSSYREEVAEAGGADLFESKRDLWRILSREDDEAQSRLSTSPVLSLPFFL